MTSDDPRINGLGAGTAMIGTVEGDPRVHEYFDNKSPERNPIKKPTVTINNTRRRAKLRSI